MSSTSAGICKYPGHGMTDKQCAHAHTCEGDCKLNKPDPLWSGKKGYPTKQTVHEDTIPEGWKT